MKNTLYMAALLSLTTACSAPSDTPDTSSAVIGRTARTDAHLTPELLQELGRISDLQPAPDGEHLLYSVTYTSVEADKSNRELYVMEWPAGGEATSHAVTHTAIKENNAVWSADGRRIFFLSNESGHTELWTMRPDGQGRTQCSHLEKEIEGFVLSPDNQHIVLIIANPVERIEADLFEGLDKTTGRLFDDMNYRHWNTFVNDCPHPYLAHLSATGEVETTSLTDLMAGEPYECPMRPFGGTESFAWHPDGQRLVYVSRKETGTRYAFSTRSSLYLYDLASQQTVDLHPVDHGYDTNPQFSPDGQYLAFQAMARNGYESDKNDLCLIRTADFPATADAPAAPIRNLTASYLNNCDEYTWHPDSQQLAFVSYSFGTSQPFSADVNTGTVAPVFADEWHDYHAPCYVGSRLVALRNDMHRPAEIFDLSCTSPAALSHENDDIFARLGDMGKIERRQMCCSNGDSMLVWVAYPVGYDPATAAHPVPTLLYCQGGPESAVSQFWSTRWNIAIMQANGYAIVLPNRHGVPGFGQRFNEQIAGDFAGQCMRDYFTAIDEVAKEPWCDTAHLGAVGASFGGYSVYWLAGHHEKRFKCFIAHCGIYNCESMYGETEEMWFADWDYGGAPFGQDGLAEGLCHTPRRGNGGVNACYTDSPHRSVTKWDTPILVIHNELDYRIPVTQGMQAFNMAKMRGLPAQFLYFPDECHWVSHPQNAVLWQRVFFRFLDRYLKQ